MKEPSDLPLFGWTPTCKILPFPERKQVWKVRRTAETLTRGSQKQIDFNRQKIFEGVENRFLKIGVEPEAAAAERAGFEQAVADEMQRQGYGSFVVNSDGAA